MYSEVDLNSAVEAGAISPEAAAAFRDHIASMRSAPIADEEPFRLLTGFNDIFVAIAAALMLVAVAKIGGEIKPWFGGVAVAALAWGLAEYFTRVRRMALPSILLLLAFVGGIAATLVGIVAVNVELLERYVGNDNETLQRQVGAAIAATVGIATAGAAWLHWRRFMVPITVAAGAVAVIGVMIALIMIAIPTAQDWAMPIVLGGGVLMFLFAMRWDMSDRERKTRRADVAFWLHLAAAPMIAHPIFRMLGIFDGAVQPGMAAVVLLLYVGFAIVALAVDRRALLVSSLAYVLYAMYALLQTAGAVELGAALTALVIGSALLTLSAFWQPMRGLVVGPLGGLGNRLPPVPVRHSAYA
ncbi:hypothetical protein K9B35_13980 [Sphingomonas sp. R647]|uniref:hypothetical protein n=1 Tax=Sphingomonas sp. R647 TaxID=2875233 RepID=UPI001CD1A24F|nr:hypothetical protein [Sphingomonas sp. R647]MCA1199082.1 hypothetical protein [Sphingomonas sp. R647]